MLESYYAIKVRDIISRGPKLFIDFTPPVECQGQIFEIAYNAIELEEEEGASRMFLNLEARKHRLRLQK